MDKKDEPNAMKEVGTDAMRYVEGYIQKLVDTATIEERQSPYVLDFKWMFDICRIYRIEIMIEYWPSIDGYALDFRNPETQRGRSEIISHAELMTCKCPDVLLKNILDRALCELEVKY